MSNEIDITKKFYDTHADNWASGHTSSFNHEMQFRKFVKKLSEKAHVIDIGSANGIHVPLFLGIGRHLKYTGIDISKSLLKIAEARYPQLAFLKANIADKKSLPKKKFDGFIAVAVLMHIPFSKWDAMFENIMSISKPHAIGYVVLPIEHPSGTPHESDNRHFTLLSEAEQKAYFKKVQWKILQQGTSEGSSRPGIWKWYIVQLP